MLGTLSSPSVSSHCLGSMGTKPNTTGTWEPCRYCSPLGAGPVLLQGNHQAGCEVSQSGARRGHCCGRGGGRAARRGHRALPARKARRRHPRNRYDPGLFACGLASSRALVDEPPKDSHRLEWQRVGIVAHSIEARKAARRLRLEGWSSCCRRRDGARPRRRGALLRDLLCTCGLYRRKLALTPRSVTNPQPPFRKFDNLH